ncbi:GNAT family N-acetyltransferase [Baekduia soli]|uniref:GNAT family N-acetyltransferase n=1 Tax=Baekduia soli TaxID=496014 RepID=UPI001651FD08|nr:GNAT family protein [Baekduia soli]
MLRRLTTADAEAFAAHVEADLEHLGAYLPWPARTADAAGAADWLRPYEHAEDGRVVAAGAWLEGRLAGGGVLFHHDAAQANMELGIWMTTGAEGRGVAAAVCRALLRLARDELGARRLEWRSATANVRSRRLAQRLGFTHEGTLRSSYVLRGERLDVDVLSLVGTEIDAAAGVTAPTGPARA